MTYFDAFLHCRQRVNTIFKIIMFLIMHNHILALLQIDGLFIGWLIKAGD